MESKLFLIAGVDSTELEKDLKALQLLGTQDLNALQQFLTDGEHLIQRDASMQDEVEEFLKANDISGEQYARARRLTLFFVEACDRYDDKPDAIVRDLNQIVSLGRDVQSFLDGLADPLLRAVKKRRRERLTKETFPALKGLSYSCDVRVDIPEFDVFKDDPLNRPLPARDWVPLALFRFSTDEDDVLRCQADLHHLQRVIKILRAAESDLLEIRRKLVSVGLVSDE